MFIPLSLEMLKEANVLHFFKGDNHTDVSNNHLILKLYLITKFMQILKGLLNF